MADLSLKDVRKSFGNVDIIKGVDLDIAHGEFIVFVGPSGCGKSTLLRLIAGLEDVTSGVLSIGGRVVNDLSPKERAIAMVFQSYALFPHMTVYDNMGFGLKIAGEPRELVDKKVREAARILKMESLLDRKPSQLSGGQRQRVAIGRAIVRNPDVFLFDEPLSNLDAALRVSTRAEIAKLHRDLGATMIYVTHDQVEAMTLADRIAVLDGGVVQQFGPPLELYHRPKNVFVAGFIGSPRMNFFSTEVVAISNGSVSIRSPAFGTLQLDAGGFEQVIGGHVTLGIRPENIRLSHGEKGQFSGAVELVERLGSQTLVEAKLGGESAVTALLQGDEDCHMGEAISLVFDPVDCHLFDSNGVAFRT
ncbi:ABC transporter ATP-binding protein [Aestuariivirga sp.]|jgi:multiple sugar transport system ATP-binding protein|uniref:ABC transporter ATP-binding protein n=1 Tax=Aestuariivirga sp. TaxID=2650926 RepID=UPI0037833628